MAREDNPLGAAIAKAARDDYDRRGRVRIEVPEWQVDGAPVVIWARPLTMAERFEVANWRAGDGPQYAAVRALILKAEDAQGKPLFTAEQEHIFLRGAVWQIVSRLSDAIIAGPTVEQAEKNSEAIPSA
jgi:hypothetical protein